MLLPVLQQVSCCRLVIAVVCIAVVASNLFASSRGHAGLLPVLSYYRASFNNRKPNKSLQLDILCPVFHRDTKLKQFSQQLGEAIAAYQYEQQHQQPLSTASSSRIATFRLLVTRYSQEEQATAKALQQELSDLTALPLHQIVMVLAGHDAKQKFERASAVNLLQRRACHSAECLVARIDVDMKILPVFFAHAVQAVYTQQNAYFPIVWSEYYPLSAQLVELHFLKQQQERGDQAPALYTTASAITDNYSFQLLEEHSEHRGYWRIHGTGMYCLSGPHAKQYMLSEAYQGWGGEDGDFYTSVRRQLSKYRITRDNEPGLVHQWHPKFCSMGLDVFDDRQWKDCQGARLGQMGSTLGVELLQQYLKESMPEEYRHHSILF